MSEIRDNAREKISRILCSVDKGLAGRAVNRKPYLLKADKILSIPELAVIDRKAELPWNEDIPKEFNELACGAEDDSDNVSRRAYMLAQQDMLKGGWVKEVKGGVI